MLHPLVAVWLVIAILLILTRPRGQVLTVFLWSCFSIPIGQVVVLGGLHFTVLRILILSVLARMATFRSSPIGREACGGIQCGRPGGGAMDTFGTSYPLPPMDGCTGANS